MNIGVLQVYKERAQAKLHTASVIALYSVVRSTVSVTGVCPDS